MRINSPCSRETMSFGVCACASSAVPLRRLVARNAGFGNGGHFGKHGGAFRPGGAEATQPAAPDVRQAGQHRRDRHGDVSGEKIDHAGRQALVRDVHHLVPVMLRNSSIERCGFVPGPAEAKLSWPGCARAKAIELFHRLRRNRGMHDEHVRRRDKLRDRGEIARRVVRDLLVHRRIDGECRRPTSSV